MGILDNTAASITVTSGTNLGTISEPPTISYTVNDTNPGQYFGVNHYLDRTTLWFGAIQFDVKSYESNVTKTNTFTVSSATWFDIYDGPHTIILRTENGTGLRSQATVSFIRTGNPEPKPDPEPERPYFPPTTINPVNPPEDIPTFSDNEVVKMGVLCRTRIDKSTQIRGSIKITQKTSYDFSSGINYESRSLCIDPRYRDGYTISNSREEFKDQITFIDTNIESEKWSWVKTTLPNNKTIFICTTCALDEYLFPLSEINVNLQGQNFKLRCLTKDEWLSVDRSILEKLDFGNQRINTNTYSLYYVVARQTTDNSNYNFLNSYSDSSYNNWIDNSSNYKNKTFVTMSYVSEVKSQLTNWQTGWKYSTIEYGAIGNARWIPVLELKNTDPIIDLPDKHNSDPTVNI